jgi:hypothetical protein
VDYVAGNTEASKINSIGRSGVRGAATAMTSMEAEIACSVRHTQINEMRSNILSHNRVTIDRIWVGNWIY